MIARTKDVVQLSVAETRHPRNLSSDGKDLLWSIVPEASGHG